MKLPDFRYNAWMNSLRALIWAELNESYKWKEGWWDEMVFKLLNEGEIQGDLSDVTVSPDWTLEYKWKKIVVYIRDQNWSREEWNYKYHFYNCPTIRSYKNNWKYDWKYVMNRNKIFTVNVINFGEVIKTNIEMELKVCKRCLQGFNYKDYKKLDTIWKEQIYNNFTREKYFEEFEWKVSLPKHNHMSKPLDTYSDNWNEISRKVREKAKYKCQDCWLDCSNDKNSLHVHHKDHNKWNNSIYNLEAICYNCHAKHHPHM